MKNFSRDILKDFFSAGRRPNQEQFEALIDSTVNILDDGYSKNSKDGLKIAPGKDNNILMSFCTKSGADPSWVFTINEQEDLLIETKELTGDFLHKNKQASPPSLSLNAQKTVIKGDIEVHGIRKGLSPDPEKFQPVADGNWHNITENLYGIYAMDITAHINGPKGAGQYAVLMAWTTHCFGNGKIRRLGSYYGFFGHKIRLRWKRNRDHTYVLQIKTRLRYKHGRQLPIHCDIIYRYKYERTIFDQTGQGR